MCLWNGGLLKKPEGLKDNQWCCLRFFVAIWLVYLLGLAGLSWYFFVINTGSQFLFPIGAGVIIGSIYFAIAGYAFYDLFLVAKGRSNRSGLEDVSFGKMLSWLMPVSVMVFFVCYSFVLIYEMPVNTKANRGVFITHPYYLGTIYKDSQLLKDKKIDDPGFTALVEKMQGLDLCATGSCKVEDVGGRQFRATSLAFIHKIPFHIAFTFSFAGVLLYTLQDVVSRFRTNDLSPGVFISYQVRYVFAICLGLAISNFYMDYWPVTTAPLLFLFIGMFPNRAMAFLEKKARSILNLEKEERETFSLHLLQGMTSYYYERFREINVTDVQNLAQSDLTFLRKKMSFSSRMLADFISQSMLFALFSSVAIVERFRLHGVRDIISLVDVLQVTTESKLLADTGLNRQELLAIVESDTLKQRIELLRQTKLKSDLDDAAGFAHP